MATVRRSFFGLPAAFSLAGLVAVAAGCDRTPVDVPDIEIPQGDCIPDRQFFEEKVWRPFMSSTCFACHNAQGAASGTDLVLQSPNQPGAVATNFGIVSNVAAYERDGISILLLKPLGDLDHGGGTIYSEDDREYRTLTQMVKRFKAPTECENTVEGDFYDNVELMDGEATLRKASLLLTSELPDSESVTMVRDGDDADLDAALDNLLLEDAFLETTKEIYNDRFLTNRYVRNNDAVNLLSDRFPDRYWHEELDEELVAPGYIDLARANTNRSVAQEPLELVAYLTKNELPFTEIVTADYMMVNPFSARVYGIDDVEFDDQNDPNEFRPGRIEGQPHAGVLTSAMWLNRFPTTETNRNRHRARMVFEFFLATDVMRLAERPVDPTAIVDFNPTLYNPDCAVCHANIDPVAGAFQNWDDDGEFNPREEGWYPDMRPPGFGEDAIPSSEWSSSLPWLAQTIIENELFDLAIVHTLYQGITGEAPLTPPTDENAEALLAYEAQRDELEAVAAAFRASGHNIKVAVKEIVKSKTFRAKNVVDEEKTPEAYATTGTARFLTPELLNRKIQATTGVRWGRDNQAPYLLNENEYLIFYGGINSNTVTQRITEPNGLMTSIAKRMANEVACAATARDFTRPMEERLLFTQVERTFEPEDANGFEVTGAAEAIRNTIVDLHERLLGERLNVDDPEIERTFNLFVETWREGKEAIANDEVGVNVHYQCRAVNDPETGEELPEEQRVNRDEEYTVRAWMAVTAYLLSDFKFLYE